MAILKHINIKNKDYSASVRYLWFEHDERTHKPLRGEDGHCIRRDGVIIDSLNCGVISFDFDCRMANRKWNKNQRAKDIMAHHWILSFDPLDLELGLTPDKAQKLGMEFARRHFAGHQCLIATHKDGHNRSKNIHVHIVCNSLRIKDLPEQPVYSQFERDRKAGYKLHPTRELMEYLKADVMRLCREHGLHQAELNQPAKKRVTDKEYRAQQRGQKRLDKVNETIKSVDKTPKQAKFQTDLEKIRQGIDTARQRAETVEQFKGILLDEYSIIVKESRGRWSYLPSGRERAVTWRRLGANYQKEFIEEFITGRVRQNQSKIAEKTVTEQPTHAESLDFSTFKNYSATIITGRLIDLNDPKIQTSYGLTQWAKLQNLKEASKRFNLISEQGLLNMDNLFDEIAAQKRRLNNSHTELKAVEAQLKEVNQLRRLLAQYYSTRSTYNEYRRSHKSSEFRNQHISEITLYEGVQKQLNAWQRKHGDI
jgi:hypothetical protein